MFWHFSGVTFHAFMYPYNFRAMFWAVTQGDKGYYFPIKNNDTATTACCNHAHTHTDVETWTKAHQTKEPVSAGRL
jgi:hypothetical protein